MQQAPTISCLSLPPGIVYDAKKPRCDRNVQKKLDGPANITELTFQAEWVESIILLLRSPESHIVQSSLQYLDKFADTEPEANYLELYSHQVLPVLLQLVEHETLFVRRYALKILSQLFVNVADICTQTPSEQVDACFELALVTYIFDEDNFMIEYAANLLLHLPAQLESIQRPQKLVASLFARIATTEDPDVLLLSLQLLHQVANGQTDIFCRHCNFPFDRILAELHSEFDRVQKAALDVLTLAAACTTIEQQAFFERPEFIDTIFSIIDNKKLDRVHAVLCALLGKVLLQPNAAARFRRDGYLERFMDFATKQTDPLIRVATLEALCNLATHVVARPVLHLDGFSDLLMEHMQVAEPPVVILAQGIQLMSSFEPAALHFVEKEAVQWLLDQLRPRAPVKGAKGAKGAPKAPKAGKKGAAAVEVDHTPKIKVATCLYLMFSYSREASQFALNASVLSIILEYLSKENDAVPIELKKQIILMLTALANEEFEMELDLAEILFKLFITPAECPDPADCNNFIVDVLHCVISYMHHTTMQEVLSRENEQLCPFLIEYFADPCKSRTVKRTLLELIAAMEDSSDLTEMLINGHVLDCLLQTKPPSDLSAGWTAAIEAIVANNISNKFAVLGRLDLNNSTEPNHFNAVQKIWDKNICCLRQVFYDPDCSPFRTIIVCNVAPPPVPDAEEEAGEEMEVEGGGEEEASSVSLKPEPPEAIALRSYFDSEVPLLAEAIEIESIQFPIQTPTDMRRAVQIIADGVTARMCRDNLPPWNDDPPSQTESSDSSSLLSYQSNYDLDPELRAAVDGHLCDLKKTVWTNNRIPLTEIRVGGHLERSLLFKVLADRLGLPCVVRMSEENNRIVWNEIAMPGEEFEGGPATTHLVNLMHHRTGSLLPLDSDSARRYQQLPAAGP